MRTRSGEDAAAAGGPLRVLQITDTHLFGSDEGTLGGLRTAESERAVLDAVRRSALPADLILVTGDLVHDGSEAGYQRLREQLAGLAPRTLVIPGNHDDPEVMRRVFARGPVTWSRSLGLGGWRFVMLNTWQPGEPGGRVGEAQLAELDAELAAAPGVPALVGLHHHPVPVGSDWIDHIGVADAAALFDCLDRHPGVRAVLWGHVHQTYDARRGDVRLLGTPSTCIQFRPESDDFALDDREPGYRWLTLHPDGRIDTGVERLAASVGAVDRQCEGYR